MPLLIALLAPLLWGSTYAVVSLYLTDYSPYWVAVWRALPAGVLLLLLHPRRPPLVWSRQFLLAFCNITAFFALLFVAAFRLPGAVAGTLGGAPPPIPMGVGRREDGGRPVSFSQLAVAEGYPVWVLGGGGALNKKREWQQAGVRGCGARTVWG
ncbi:EamA family transporter, partial [Aeromonas caviae]|uniref:EamA family transporter n=1 Tax=Aeromonas caviae TaxID=648 RepID=UPI001EEF01E9